MGLSGKTTEEKIWNFLIGKGLNENGAVGLMGNLYAESGLSPINMQNSYEKKLGCTDETYTQSVDNGDYTNFIKDSVGYGLAQWTFWSRKQNLINFVRSRGKSIGDLESQLEFLYKELSEGYKSVLAVLKSSKTVLEASTAVLTGYEKPADQGLTVKAKRASYGQKYYNKYASKSGGTNIMSNSSLVNCKVMSPNHSGARTHKIDRITPHCVVGQLSAESIGGCFTSTSRNASCNYGIGTNGKVVLCVDEGNRSWCSSSGTNDQRAVTIECASDKSEPYAMNSSVYNKLVDLCVDICKRNGKNKLIWFGDKDKTLNYNPSSDEMIITVHRWFANKSCPGDWLYSRLGNLANDVTSALCGSNSEKPSENNSGGTMYRVQVGAFGVKSNADTMLSKVKSRGFDAFITQVDGMYKVQVGAFSVKANAEAQLQKVKNAGFDAFITTKAGTQVSETTPEKSVTEVAREVIAGKLGNGADRKKKLEAAGYNYSEVQKKVNELL